MNRWRIARNTFFRLSLLVFLATLYQVNEHTVSEQVVKCSCGVALKVKPIHYGKRVKCPKCGNALTVPTPQNQPSSTPPPPPREATNPPQRQRPSPAVNEPSANAPASPPGSPPAEAKGRGGRFGRLTVSGWVVIIASLAVGGLCMFLVSNPLAKGQNKNDQRIGALAATVGGGAFFFIAKLIAAKIGFPIRTLADSVTVEDLGALFREGEDSGARTAKYQEAAVRHRGRIAGRTRLARIFLLIAAVTFVVPFVLVNFFPNQVEKIHDALMLTMVFIPIFSLGAWVLMASDKSRYAWQLELQEKAEFLGLQFSDVADAKFLGILGAFDSFDRAIEDHGRNCVYGTLNGTQVSVFEYAISLPSATTRTGKVIVSQTVALAFGISIAIPNFTLIARGMGERISRFFGRGTRKISDLTDFATDYDLKCSAPDFSLDFLPLETLQEIHDNLFDVEVNNRTLLVFRRKKVWNMEGLESLIRVTLAINDALAGK